MAITIYPIPATLPVNAAVEVGGNLTALTQLVQVNQQVLAMLGVMTLQLAAISGVSADPAELLNDNSFSPIQ